MSHLELSSNISSSKNKNYMTFFGRSDNWRNLLPLWYCLPFSWYYNNKNHWRRSKDRNQSSNFDSDLSDQFLSSFLTQPLQRLNGNVAQDCLRQKIQRDFAMHHLISFCKYHKHHHLLWSNLLRNLIAYTVDWTYLWKTQYNLVSFCKIVRRVQGSAGCSLKYALQHYCHRNA